MDERLEVETPFGPVWLRGRDTGKPVFLVIHGAFSGPEGFGQVTASGMDVFDALLPGDHCPDLIATSVGVWGAAFRAALASALPARDVAFLGVSTGALVGLAMRSPQVRRMILIEPPLRPHLAWPVRTWPDRSPEWGADMLWHVLGVARGRSEPRDYAHLLRDLTIPTVALVGAIELGEPRDTRTLPSLVDPQSRADLERCANIDVRVVPGAGHNIPRDGGDALRRALNEARNALLYCTS